MEGPSDTNAGRLHHPAPLATQVITLVDILAVATLQEEVVARVAVVAGVAIQVAILMVATLAGEPPPSSF